ncbi:hypothetical protein PM8797T_23204 [Gimesia maris DSM 8797]|uniref:Uncharacterized protein n=1 Tax=Gimesia maris TaxID=122 RepID=A0ABX5YRA7_9PLAN|nr:hypothetical protein PM8797T_23204 [Gimesia maris DSM 8797]QEG18251.1 hypothetical protein GmarT_41370 [Gimesia maris]
MSFLKRTAGFLTGTVRSVGSTLNVLTGGISVKTEDVPISPTVIDSLSLSDIEQWMKRNMLTVDEPVKVAVVRERHGDLYKISYVVLNQRNKRCKDSEGKIRAQAQLVREISPDLNEFLGNHNSVLLNL